MDHECDPRHGMGTGAMGVAGKMVLSTVAMLWKGGLVVVATAVLVGVVSRPEGETPSLESPHSKHLIVEEDDQHGFAFLRFRTAETDRPTHLIVKSPAGDVIATLSYNHITDSLCFAFADVGSVRATTWIQHDRSTATSTLTPRTRTQLDHGTDGSIAMRAWERDPALTDLEIGRLWIPPGSHAAAARTPPPAPPSRPKEGQESIKTNELDN